MFDGNQGLNHEKVIGKITEDGQVMPIELERASNDLLKVANTRMTSWAEKNHKQKLIDILYKMEYYKYNQSVFLNNNLTTLDE